MNRSGVANCRSTVRGYIWGILVDCKFLSDRLVTAAGYLVDDKISGSRTRVDASEDAMRKKLCVSLTVSVLTMASPMAARKNCPLVCREQVSVCRHACGEKRAREKAVCYASCVAIVKRCRQAPDAVTCLPGV